MSIHCVTLPTGDDSDSDSSSDLIPPPPVRHVAPKRYEAPEPAAEEEKNPFEVTDDDGDPVPVENVDYVSIGLPPLSFDSDPFLTPINAVEFTVKRHKIWIGGIKGYKFSLSIAGYIILVAKRKMKFLKKTWYMSRSMNFSIDTPDLAGILIRNRTKKMFTLLSPRERQSDRMRPALAGIDVTTHNVILGNNLWIENEQDDIFTVPYTEDTFIKLVYSKEGKSAKNATLTIPGEKEPCFKSQKQSDGTVIVRASAPLCISQAFGISMSLFIQ